MEETVIEMSEELRHQCMSIFKYVRDCYGSEINKSILFREFNIGENNKEKIFKFLESNGIKFVKTSKEPQKKGLGQKKVVVKGNFEVPHFDNPYNNPYDDFYQPPIRKATISSASEPKVTSSKATAKSLADSVIKRTAEEIQKKKEQEKVLEDLRKVSFQSGYYGKKSVSNFNTKT